MSDTKILLRFDDVCSTIDRKKWDLVCETLTRFNIKPILAVIPHNANEEFKAEQENPDFWKQMKELESRGWVIALHGFDHVYLTNDSGIMGITARSEFAGVEKRIQIEKIQKGVQIFKENGISPKVWVAPAHSFDRTTIDILKGNGISIISDGLSDFPFRKYGLEWVPCQLWSFSIPRKKGIFTICIHLFKMNYNEVEQLCKDIEKNQSIIVDLNYAITHRRRTGSCDSIISSLKSFKRKIRSHVRK